METILVTTCCPAHSLYNNSVVLVRAFSFSYSHIARFINTLYYSKIQENILFLVTVLLKNTKRFSFSYAYEYHLLF